MQPTLLGQVKVQEVPNNTGDHLVFSKEIYWLCIFRLVFFFKYFFFSHIYHCILNVKCWPVYKTYFR
jgi:hypothetical protein